MPLLRLFAVVAVALVLGVGSAQATLSAVSVPTDAGFDDPSTITAVALGQSGQLVGAPNGLNGFLDYNDGFFQAAFRFAVSGASTLVGEVVINSPDGFQVLGIGLNGNNETFLGSSDFVNGRASFFFQNSGLSGFDEVILFALVSDTGAGAPTLTGTFAAIPEPATWAMMIIGFGLVAGRLRRPATSLAV